MIFRQLSDQFKFWISGKSDFLLDDKSLTVSREDIYQNRIEEFRELKQESHRLNLPKANGFTAYAPEIPIGGDLL